MPLRIGMLTNLPHLVSRCRPPLAPPLQGWPPRLSHLGALTGIRLESASPPRRLNYGLKKGDSCRASRSWGAGGAGSNVILRGRGSNGAGCIASTVLCVRQRPRCGRLAHRPPPGRGDAPLPTPHKPQHLTGGRAVVAALQSPRHRRQPGGCPSSSVIRSATVGHGRLGDRLA